MTPAETEAYLVAIMEKAINPPAAARAIMAAGFCSQTTLDDDLADLWERIGPQTHGKQSSLRTIRLTWSPEAAWVRCWRFQTKDTDLGSALKRVIANVDSYFDSKMPWHDWAESVGIPQTRPRPTRLR